MEHVVENGARSPALHALFRMISLKIRIIVSALFFVLCPRWNSDIQNVANVYYLRALVALLHDYQWLRFEYRDTQKSTVRIFIDSKPLLVELANPGWILERARRRCILVEELLCFFRRF